MQRSIIVLVTLLAVSLAAAQTFDVVAPSEARYRIRERLLGIWLPATVGTTSAVAGTVTLDGPVVVAGSRVDVEAARITSDQALRDAAVRSESLQTDDHPLVTFVPVRITGLPSPLPLEGTVEVDIIGDLRIRDVVRRVRWAGTARFEDDRVLLDARTAVTFDVFELPKPSLGGIVVLDDEIVLEVSLVLARR